MVVWLAWYSDDVYPHSVGIFSSETKAMQACEDDHKKTIYADEPFNWHYGSAKFSNDYSYTVIAFEVDKPIE